MCARITNPMKPISARDSTSIQLISMDIKIVFCNKIFTYFKEVHTFFINELNNNGTLME